MPHTFRLREPIIPSIVPPPFMIGGTGAPSFECLRLISGAADLELKSTNTTKKLRYCHLTQKKRRFTNRSISKIIDLTFDGDLDINDAETFLKKSATENRAFWEELRSELSFCLFSRNTSNVESFLHIYRIFELISVALPLIYASKISDFRESVNFIKSLSNNDRDKDLAILRYFTKAIARDGNLSNLPIDFPFVGMDMSTGTAFSRQLTSYVFSDNKIQYSFFTNSYEGVIIDFQSVPSFIVSCRNRLFHNAISNENFKLDPLHGAERVCSTLVDPSLYWFGLILTEIFKAQASRYV